MKKVNTNIGINFTAIKFDVNTFAFINKHEGNEGDRISLLTKEEDYCR